MYQASLVIHGDFPSSDAKFPTFFHIFGPIAPRILGFSQDFLSSDVTFPTFVRLFGAIAPRILRFFHRTFPTNIHTHTMVQNLYNFTEILTQKKFVCKAIFYIFKRRPARIDLCKAIFYIFGSYSPTLKFMYVIVLAGMVDRWRHHNPKIVCKPERDQDLMSQ